MKILLGVLVLIVIFLGSLWFSVTNTTLDIPDNIPPQGIGVVQESFRRGVSNFAIFPPYYTISVDQDLSISVGVKNTDAVPHEFKINVIPAFPHNDWLAIEGTSIIDPGSRGFWAAQADPPPDTAPGLYEFTFVACIEPIESAEECTLETYNWGEPQEIKIILELSR